MGGRSGTPPAADSAPRGAGRSGFRERLRQAASEEGRLGQALEQLRRPENSTTPSGGPASDRRLLDRLRERGLGTLPGTAPGTRQQTLPGQVSPPAPGSTAITPRPEGSRSIMPGGGGATPGRSTNLSEIRKRIREQQGEPARVPPSPSSKLPEVIPPGKVVDPSPSRKDRLGEMQNRIVRDLDFPSGKSDGPANGGKPSDSTRGKPPGPQKESPQGPGRGKGFDVNRSGGPGHDRPQRAEVRFADRYKAGQFHSMGRGAVATKMRLDDQFRLRDHGDVARRMDLHKHGTGHVRDPRMAGHYASLGLHYYGYHGPVAAHYTRHCFRYKYYGPSFFPVSCWYPIWDPWVSWSWRYRCHPYWDPRPLWCRPVYYDPCPLWVYWSVPVWTPLPVVTCGTWVDVPRVAAVAPCDLQLLAVRFVDPGHPEEKLGPRYRVWFRNNSGAPVTQPFNVVLLAANDANLAAGLPQAGVRVTAIDAGDTQSVDIRLPLEATMIARDPLGQPAGFKTLHVLVDAQRETPDALRENNGAILGAGDIFPVDPSTFDVTPTAGRPGNELLVAGEGFGPGPGRVLVFVGAQELDCEILGWYDLGVRVTLPPQAVVGPTAAELVVVRADGAAANPAQITLLP